VEFREKRRGENRRESLNLGSKIEGAAAWRGTVRQRHLGSSPGSCGENPPYSGPSYHAKVGPQDIKKNDPAPVPGTTL